jgi:septal ring factor EnvC (AmiA/AmiB activator)
MTQIQKMTKLFAVILLTALCMGCILSLGKCSKKRPPSEQHKTATVEALQQNVTISEQQYQQSIALLEHQNRWLEEELKKISGNLAEVERKARDKEKSLKALIKPLPGVSGNSRPVLKEQTATRQFYEYEPTKISVDTTALTGCDSLKIEVAEYIEINIQKDSLHTQQVKTLETKAQLKDSVIARQSSQHEKLKSIMQSSLDAQAAAIADMRYYKRQFKKQRVKAKLFTGISAVLSGILTYQLIKSQ